MTSLPCPAEVQAYLEALDFSNPADAQKGHDYLWLVNYIGALSVYQAQPSLDARLGPEGNDSIPLLASRGD